MKFNQAKHLIVLNWRLFAGISFSLGRDNVRISQLYLFVPALLALVVAAYLRDSSTTLFAVFLMSLLLLEMGKVAHKAGIDPICFCDLDIPYSQKIRNIVLGELLGVKLISLFLFGMLGLLRADDLIALPILVVLYSIMNVLLVLMWIIGNRIRGVSIIYQWMLIFLLTFLFGVSGLNFVQTEAVHDLHLAFQEGIEANFIAILAGSFLSLIGLYYAGIFFTRRLCEKRPLINPESFPREMV